MDAPSSTSPDEARAVHVERLAEAAVRVLIDSTTTEADQLLRIDAARRVAERFGWTVTVDDDLRTTADALGLDLDAPPSARWRR